LSTFTEKKRAALSVVTFVAGAALAYWGQPLIHNNSDAITLIATIFSILAGLLIGVITLISDPSLIPGTTFQSGYLGKEVLRRRLRRHRLLFVVYLVTLVLILASFLIGDRHPPTLVWLERFYVFFSTVGFIYSFTLPWTLARIQEERYDSMLAQRRPPDRQEPSPPAT
jgi:peptidoglycan/LPS O-acetylase OafA/YrhL